MTFTPYIRRPRAATSSLTAQQVAKAYNAPTDVTGRGCTVGIIELGGGFAPADFPGVVSVPVDGGSNSPDGANGADGEVQLDIEVVASVASGATIRVYFCPNTDTGFLAAIVQAAKECDVVTISWGGPESSWAKSSLDEFNAAFLTARQAKVAVYVAAGDSGADDGTGSPTADFPASSPNVIGCGGTRLTLTSAGARSAEVTWDDSDSSSATGGGVSKHWPGRQVPDVAGNADPQTGYQVTIDGSPYVIGGTSAVAPLYAGLTALLFEALGHRPSDILTTLAANPTLFYDVTVGDNGAYRAGPGRDNVTGWGVVDASKLLAVYQGTVGPPPTPTPAPTPAPSGTWFRSWDDGDDFAAINDWAGKRHTGINRTAAQAWARGK